MADMKYYIFNQETKQWSEQAYSIEVLKSAGLSATSMLGLADDSNTVITYIDALNQEMLQEKKQKKETQQVNNSAEQADRIERLYTYRLMRRAVNIWLFITYFSIFTSVLLALLFAILGRELRDSGDAALLTLVTIGATLCLSSVAVKLVSKRALEGLDKGLLTK